MPEWACEIIPEVHSERPMWNMKFITPEVLHAISSTVYWDDIEVNADFFRAFAQDVIENMDTPGQRSIYVHTPWIDLHGWMQLR